MKRQICTLFDPKLKSNIKKRTLARYRKNPLATSHKKRRFIAFRWHDSHRSRSHSPHPAKLSTSWSQPRARTTSEQKITSLHHKSRTSSRNQSPYSSKSSLRRSQSIENIANLADKDYHFESLPFPPEWPPSQSRHKNKLFTNTQQTTSMENIPPV